MGPLRSFADLLQAFSEVETTTSTRSTQRYQFELQDRVCSFTVYSPLSSVAPLPPTPFESTGLQIVRRKIESVDFTNLSSEDVKALYFAFKVLFVDKATGFFRKQPDTKSIQDTMNQVVGIPIVCEYMRKQGFDEFVLTIEKNVKVIEKYFTLLKNNKKLDGLVPYFSFILFQLYYNLAEASQRYDIENNSVTAHCYFQKIFSLYESLRPSIQEDPKVKKVYEEALFSRCRSPEKLLDSFLEYIEQRPSSSFSQTHFDLLQNLSKQFSEKEDAILSMFCDAKINQLMKKFSTSAQMTGNAAFLPTEKMLIDRQQKRLDAICRNFSCFKRSGDLFQIYFAKSIPGDFRRRLSGLLPERRDVTIAFKEGSQNQILEIRNGYFLDDLELQKIQEKVCHLQEQIKQQESQTSGSYVLPTEASVEIVHNKKKKKGKVQNEKVVAEQPIVSIQKQEFEASELGFTADAVKNEKFYLCRQRKESAFSLYLFAKDTEDEQMKARLKDAKIAYLQGDTGFKWHIGFDSETGKRVSIPYYKSFDSVRKKIRYFPKEMITSEKNVAYGSFEAVNTKTAEGKKQSNVSRSITIISNK